MAQQGELGFEDLELFKTEKIGIIRSKKNYSDFSKDPNTLLQSIVDSWTNSIDLFAVADGKDDQLLRKPQKAAIFSALSHLESSNEPATIVMPTGTGKTETMLVLMLLAKCEKILILVPSDQLRQQTVNKFISLGILPKLKGFKSAVKFPIVGEIRHIPKKTEEIDELFDKCNVVVAVAHSIGRSSPFLLNYISTKISHLFIDEAHHVTAKTWKGIRSHFIKNKKNILQFTATPFRNDKDLVDGKIIYNYSLKSAFEAGFFKKINFEGILEWDNEKSDQAISEKAVEILKNDLSSASNFDHLLMARTASIDRARDVFNIYKTKYPEYNPVLVHSELSASERKFALEQVLNRRSRIIICVDMLGEGFDLPNLKIAALHDIHKSLPITLQFTGRFTRSNSPTSIGEAHVISNIANIKVREELEKLYAQDANWNSILQYHSDEAIKKQITFAEFIESFEKKDEEISLQNIRPKMSTVVYKVEKGKSWNPSAFVDSFSKNNGNKIIKFALNKKENVLVIVEGRKDLIDWGLFKDIRNLIWDLYLVYWDSKQNLLFINSSNNASLHENLAKAVGGKNVQLIKGEDVFRCFYNVNRIIFNNVGLNNPWGKAIRYTMYTGIDVEKGLGEVSTKTKSNIYGVGFENGEKMGYGCSYKGRIWSRRIGNIQEFIDWCKNCGKKLLNNELDPDKLILNQSVIRTIALQYPDSKPITIEWDEDVYLGQDRYIQIIHSGKNYSFDQIGIDLVDDEKNMFKVYNDVFETVYSINITTSKDGNSSDYGYKLVKGDLVEIKIGPQEKIKLEDYFKEHDPLIRFVDGSFIQGNLLCRPRNTPVSLYDKGKIEVWDWDKLGVDIKKESQGKSKDKASIQYQVIQHLKKEKFELIFDDDSPGEIADVIAAKIEKDVIKLRLYHCKFSSDSIPGDRVNDLQVVCGQAQRSIQWRAKNHEIFDQLIRRARLTKVNGFEYGDEKIAKLYKDQSKLLYPIEFSIYIVQPGISKSKISSNSLNLLGATELYLNDTYQIPLLMIGSE